jgi:inositol phosphorylceramide synthase catalytic subunit
LNFASDLNVALAFRPSSFAARDESRFRWLALLLGLGHLAFCALTGLRVEHLLADGLLIMLPWLGDAPLQFIRASLPLWITGVVVDNQRYLPLLGPIHTGDLRALEASLFPSVGGLTWPEWFNSHPNIVCDVACGFVYGAYLLEFLLPALLLYYRAERRLYTAMLWSFFIANALGAIIYVFFPVAPPWYVIAHGTGPADPSAAPGLGGTARFDALLGIHFFSAFYERNPHVFGAMPSLHVAYPLLVVCYTWSRGWKWRIPTLCFFALVTFAAVYLAHHYILDILAGYAVTALSVLGGGFIARAGRWPSLAR